MIAFLIPILLITLFLLFYRWTKRRERKTLEREARLKEKDLDYLLDYDEDDEYLQDSQLEWRNEVKSGETEW